MQMYIDGANLLDGLQENHTGNRFDNVTVSTGRTEDSQKYKQTETWSKGEKKTEAIYQKPQQENKSRTVEDVMQQAENMDAAQMKKQMVIASNTTTTTNCRQVEEEGFSLSSTKIETIVTVTDKIKIQLAKAGVDISYFGDTLNTSQLETLTGDAALAQELAGKIKQQADVPFTEENIEDFRDAMQQIRELHSLQEGAIKYLLDNRLSPTIANLYKAQYSGSAVYQSQNTEKLDVSGMQEQISKIITQSGQIENQQTMSDCMWLLQNEIPLTAENLNYYEQLKELQFPLKEEDMIVKMLTAMEEGSRPQDTVLMNYYSLARQAHEAIVALGQATDEDLAYTIYKHQPVTLQNLRQAHALQQADAINAQEAENVAELIKSANALSAQQQSSANVIDAANIQPGTRDVNVNAENTQLNISEMQSTSDDMQADRTGLQPVAMQDSKLPVSSKIEAQTTSSGIQAETDAVNTIVSAQQDTNQNMGQNQSGQYLASPYTSMSIALVAARRQLEEIRLSMTVDASYEMLKHGISVNTKSMEELIYQLKEIENGYFRHLLTEGGYEATEENIRQFVNAEEKIEQLKELPAYAIGAKNLEIHTLAQLHEEGRQMQQNFQQANERYETMQTQVRKDLGDSIKKAFANIDDILKELGQDVSDANERAARILGYNRITITPENLMRMKAADQQVQQVFQNLTPVVVREFIGRGYNPLDMDFEELNYKAEQIKSELGDDISEDSYSEYLYKLEKNKSISPEERSSYIGIYRLMNQVVKSDGAAVGALINQGAKLTMRNLFTQVRLAQRGEMDITVDKNFGELESGGYRDSVIRQIEEGYQKQCLKQALQEISPERMRTVAEKTDWEEMNPEQFLQQIEEAPEDLEAEEAYYQHKLDDLETCAHMPKEVYKMMEQYGLPNTVLHAMAASEMIYNRNDAFRKFFHMDLNRNRREDVFAHPEEYMAKNDDGTVDVDFDALRQQMIERFSDDLKKPRELAKALAELADCAEKCMSTMIIEPDVSSIDLRSMKLIHAQFSMASKMASAECFSMPIVVDGEVTNVTLKIVRGRQEKGLVNITLQTDHYGKIAAELKAKQKGIDGYVTAESKKTCDMLQGLQDELANAIRQEDEEKPMLHFVTSSQLDLNDFSAKSGESKEPETEELRQLQTKTLYQMAEGFIKVLSRIDKENI